MARLTAEQWAKIRTERETTGVSFRVLANKYKVSDAAIVKRAKSEGWSNGSDCDEIIRRKVSEKVSGLANLADPKKRAAAIEAESDRRAAIQIKHRTEWNPVGTLIREAVRIRKTNSKDAVDKVRLAKMIAETLRMKQECERKAWGLDIVVDPNALKNMTDEQLEALAQGKLPSGLRVH